MRSSEEIVASLREAFGAVGVVLPSLCVDPVTGAGKEPYALVQLGRCNVRTAERLVAVLRDAAEVRRRPLAAPPADAPAPR
ncbi:hypothetical protein ACWD6Q_05465 [Streptomyces nigra]|jgi:hypothetical protein|uniref:Uncharacterized protein n=1 Tax=Streptomyces nigra TaxID=1827580 RepID=A0ABZ1IYW5_9ACTN|nr:MULTISPECIES: hypothetical protein [Streptomyces]AWE50966.1 hypothetical protein DC008_15410 [Streptomyces nigra]MBQ0998989.1 hypothetical protein [Streptomyces sp. RK62]MCF2535457.1 hypothetical protein [Streptomyces sp. FB2]RDS62321.1 hypothetical protein DWC19_26270 [Streptomyces sp. M7]